MITTIIFSFDRAIQLDLLLESIYKFDKQKLLNLHIIYAVSNSEFEKGYEQLRGKYSFCHWHKEAQFNQHFVWPHFNTYWHNYYWWFKYKHNRSIKSNFNQIVQSLVNDTTNEFVMFLTDDSLIINQIEINAESLLKIIQNGYNYSFSLRHGKNIFGGKYLQNNNIIQWNRSDKHEHPEWSYPFSIDGHIYNRMVLQKIFQKVIFTNPSTLEGNVACYVKEKNLFKQLFANQQSCLCGFELNRVQDVSDNNNLNIDGQLLNGYFLKGYSLNIKYDTAKMLYFRPNVKGVELLKKNFESIKIL